MARGLDGAGVPRTHLRPLARLELAFQVDAGQSLRPLDEGLHRGVIGMGRHQARLLVAHSPIAQGSSQRRQRVQPPLQPGALLDRARRLGFELTLRCLDRLGKML